MKKTLYEKTAEDYLEDEKLPPDPVDNAEELSTDLEEDEVDHLFGINHDHSYKEELDEYDDDGFDDDDYDDDDYYDDEDDYMSGNLVDRKVSWVRRESSEKDIDNIKRLIREGKNMQIKLGRMIERYEALLDDEEEKI